MVKDLKFATQTLEEFIIPICNLCKNRRLQEPGITCNAFPKGIPDAILDNESDHRKPFKGDGGIRFEPVNKHAVNLAKRNFDK